MAVRLTIEALTEGLRRGRTDAQIASDAGVSKRTVRNHLARYGAERGGAMPRAARLEAEAHRLADKLQVIYMELDRVKRQAKEQDRDCMARLMELAEKLKERRYRWLYSVSRRTR